MNSEKIFQYSEDFLQEILEDLIELKIKKQSNPQSKDFENKLKSILGKNFEESELKLLISDNDKIFKEKIINKFKETRKERIKLLSESQSKEIEKRIFYNQLI